MPLLDHFHPPLSVLRHWESFHARWCAAIADSLNETLLPELYFAEAQVHAGNRVEIEIGTFEDESAITAPDAEFDAIIPPSARVKIFSTEAGPVLVVAIELVSPGNKDREIEKEAFVQKCAAYLRAGVGVLTIDIVTDRHADLNRRLLALLHAPDAVVSPPSALAAAPYRPLRRIAAPAANDEAHEDRIQVWLSGLAVGEVLPVMPLPLNKEQLLRLDLEATYTKARQVMRLPA